MKKGVFQVCTSVILIPSLNSNLSKQSKTAATNVGRRQKVPKMKIVFFQQRASNDNTDCISLVPSPFSRGAWYPLFAHAPDLYVNLQ